MMKRIRQYIRYTIKELEDYVKLEGSCIDKIYDTMHIGLRPCDLNDFNESILRIISRTKIGLYDAKLKGVVLDAKKIKVLSNKGAIRGDDPTIHLDLGANFYVFQPLIGSVMRGIVKHISITQNNECVVGVIVYRVFSVPIKLQNCINKNFNKNTEIEIRIKSFDLQCSMPFIEGELIAKEESLDENQIDDFEDEEDQFDDEDQRRELSQISNLTPYLYDNMCEEIKVEETILNENDLEESVENNIQIQSQTSTETHGTKQIKREQNTSLNSLSSSLTDKSVSNKKTKRSRVASKSSINEIPVKIEIVDDNQYHDKLNSLSSEQLSAEMNGQYITLNETDAQNSSLTDKSVSSKKTKRSRAASKSSINEIPVKIEIVDDYQYHDKLNSLSSEQLSAEMNGQYITLNETDAQNSSLTDKSVSNKKTKRSRAASKSSINEIPVKIEIVDDYQYHDKLNSLSSEQLSAEMNGQYNTLDETDAQNSSLTDKSVSSKKTKRSRTASKSSINEIPVKIEIVDDNQYHDKLNSLSSEQLSAEMNGQYNTLDETDAQNSSLTDKSVSYKKTKRSRAASKSSINEIPVKIEIVDDNQYHDKLNSLSSEQLSAEMNEQCNTLKKVKRKKSDRHETDSLNSSLTDKSVSKKKTKRSHTVSKDLFDKIPVKIEIDDIQYDDE